MVAPPVIPAGGAAGAGGLFGSLGPAAGFAGDLGSIFGVASGIAGLFGGDGGDGPSPYKHLKKGIQWRVRDAKAAGVHPLFALGYSGSSPVAQIGRETGQDLSRAVMATRTRGERDEALYGLAVERAELENDLLRSQIARLQADQIGPPMASAMPGSEDLPGVGVEVKPDKISATIPGQPSSRAGMRPERTWMRTATGVQAVPNMDAMEDADISNPAALAWYWRNLALPNIGGGHAPPQSWLPKGATGWYYSRTHQEWRPVGPDGKPWYEFTWPDVFRMFRKRMKQSYGPGPADRSFYSGS